MAHDHDAFFDVAHCLNRLGRLITDKLRSYSVAHREVMPSVVHHTDPVLCKNSAVPSIYSSARTELDLSPVCRPPYSLPRADITAYLLPWCTTRIEAKSSLGPDSHHPIISLSGIPSAVMVLRILHPILASTLCAANPIVSKNTNGARKRES